MISCLSFGSEERNIFLAHYTREVFHDTFFDTYADTLLLGWSTDSSVLTERISSNISPRRDAQ